MEQSTNSIFKPGKIIDDKWIIIEMIGQGGMGEVYRAHQMNLKRDVAIKIVSEEMLKSLEDDPEEIDIAFGRFQREVQTMAQVRHSNILNIFDYGTVKSDIDGDENLIEYIVMEYIPGNTLRYTMSDEGLEDEPELIVFWIEKYFIPVLNGVEIIHNQDIFHRDLKPENIFMDGEIPKIADFGLARSYRMKAVSNSLEVKGTLAYMAPEQFSDFRKADLGADIYALGKILFEAVNGTITQKTIPFTMVKLENTDSPFLKNLDLIIQKATAEEKDKRFNSIDEFRNNLVKSLEIQEQDSMEETAFQTDKPAAFQRFSKLILASFFITLFSLAAMVVWHLRSEPENVLNFSKPYKHETNKEKNDEIVTVPEKLSDLKNEIHGKDGSQMILTGDKTGSAPEKPDNVLFYIDKTKTSCSLYISFLNEMRNKITVEKGIVKLENKILLYLGTGSEPEDQIIYQHNRFHLIKPEKGNLPVTRVTFYGASEYAEHFGKKLLTEKEWIYAYIFHKKKIIKSKPASPILDNMGLTVKEWVYSSDDAETQEKNRLIPEKDAISIPGVMDVSRIEKKTKSVLRYPWESFSDVGFRTKININ